MIGMISESLNGLFVNGFVRQVAIEVDKRRHRRSVSFNWI